jgi:hypothetical protein
MGDDATKIIRVMSCLSKPFEVKDFGELRYFLGIEVARSKKIILQRKYILDLLSDMGMMECRAAPTSMDQNKKVIAQFGKLRDKERYGRLLEDCCIVSHEIRYCICTWRRYMHEPRSGHPDVVHQILRYSKG